MKASILISSHDRLELLRRTLFSIAARPPSVPFEVVVADDGSTQDVLGLLRDYQACFPWTFARVDAAEFERQTGVRKFFNNPSWTNNVAARLARGDWLFLQGNEVIAWGDAYDRLLAEAEARPQRHVLALSSTCDVPPEVLGALDSLGSNFSEAMAAYCARLPLATPSFHTDVTNYLSLTSRALWETLGGYDERYVGGLGKEDSDFVRRCRAVPGWQDAHNLVRSEALSLHQSHGGRTCHGGQDQSVISDERWREGERLSKAVWDSWDGTHPNAQGWEPGAVGVVEVVRND